MSPLMAFVTKANLPSSVLTIQQVSDLPLRAVGVHVLAGERALGPRLAQDGVLLRREPLSPLPAAAGYRK